MRKLAACLSVLLAVAALAEIPEMTSTGIPLFRRDVSAIQMLVNQSLKAGATNADGRTVITPGSDPMKAITAAGAAWSGIASALVNFLPVQSTTLSNNPQDGKFVLTIEDTQANRSVVGSFLAITLYTFTADGAIFDSDVVFNPSVVSGGVLYPLSTDHTIGSYDLQSLVVHELGHSLGSSHSPVISATMYQSQGSFSSFNSVAEVTLHQTLSADDIAFATTRYPAPGAAAQVGSIAGTVQYSTGEPVAGAMVVAVDPAAGTTIGGLASLDDGTYRLDALPPGSYYVYAQPANGPVAATNLSGVPNISRANTNFRVTFSGGNATPTAIKVSAGQQGAADILVDPGTPLMHVDFLGTGSVGGTDWAYIIGPKGSAGGGAADVLLWGEGLDATITEDEVRLLGPGATLRAGTLHQQTTAAQQGITPLRFTVDLAARPANTPITVAVVKGTDAAVFTGGFFIAGGTSGCGYAVSSKLVAVPAAGGQGTVAVTAGSGCPWTVAGGASWLKIASTTAASGNGSVALTADPNTGAARSAVLTIAGQSVTVNQDGAPPAASPAITGVVNGASFQPGIEAGSWVTIQGTNLANTRPGRTWRNDEIVAGRLPISLDGVSVTINGKAAYVYYISPTQINVQAPTDTATGPVNVVVTNNGAVSAPATAQLQQYAPALFMAGATSFAIATRYPDNALVADPAVIPGAVAAAAGDVLILWATGMGPTNPATAAGQVVTKAPAVATMPAVTIGGVQAQVIAGALSPGSVGLYQVAIQMPASVPSGSAEVRVSVGGVTSAAGVNVFVKVP